jgi:hypothetical protein
VLALLLLDTARGDLESEHSERYFQDAFLFLHVATLCIHRTELPDGIFLYRNPQIWKALEWNILNFLNRYFEYFVVICLIGMYMTIWYILWIFAIFFGGT